MLALTSEPARALKVATPTILVLLGAAAFAMHRAAGPVAALSLLAAAAISLLLAVIVVAQRQLRRADERQRLGQQALDAVPRAIFVMDAARPRTPNVYVNAAYAALTGYGAREAVAGGFDARAIFAGDADAPTLADGVEQGTARAVIRRRDGTTFPAKLELRAIARDGGGRYLLGTIEDVTPGERAVDRRTSGSEVEGGGRATSAFLSWLTHELRSPLNACVMWLDVLALGPPSDKLPKAVEAIKRGLARQARLVNDLNDAAKVAAGGFEMRFERLDLVALVASEVDAWQLLALGKQLRFHHRIELTAASVDGDAQRLSQALSHLLESSINSTPADGRVDLRVYGSDGVCIVEVEDTGAALSVEDAALLFVPLERASTSAKTRSGLGLGLAVAHYIVTRHGGSLVAFSELASTRFVLTLPLVADPLESAAAP